MRGIFIVSAVFVGLLCAGCVTEARKAVAPAEKTSTAPQEVAEAKPVPVPADVILLPMPRKVVFAPDGAAVAVKGAPAVTVDKAVMPHDQGYVLYIDGTGAVKIQGNNDAGVFYARQTLKQLERQYEGTGKLPVVHIEDWPDFPNRGAMLDVARDKVPTMDTLRQLVDLFAEMKFNQLQLYTEHTFAYKGHETVWKDASPMTPEDIRVLDAYCRDRFIELVPNQNSFGHMERWLSHPEYAKYAEIKGGGDLCPTDRACVDLLRGMYDDLLPNFTSKQCNVGCDETFSIGKGRSKAAVKKLGEGRVYLNFIKEIQKIVSSHGKTMQFWGDIIMMHPELIKELPPNVIAMEWGYEAKHPFLEHGKKFAESGIPYYVVPGTSSWNSLLGRTDNALENLRNAAFNGFANGAKGFLVTDWGDGGHWQFIPVSFTPFAYGAALSWAMDANKDLPLAKALDAHVFQDAAGMMGQAALDLGNAHLKTNVTIGNSSVYYGLLTSSTEGSPSKGALKAMTVDSINGAEKAIDDSLARIAQSRMARPDAATMVAEFNTDAALAKIALRLGRERITCGDVGTSQLPAAKRHAIAKDLQPVVDKFKDLWLVRNREGGLKDSTGRLQGLVDRLSK